MTPSQTLIIQHKRSLLSLWSHKDQCRMHVCFFVLKLPELHLLSLPTQPQSLALVPQLLLLTLKSPLLPFLIYWISKILLLKKKLASSRGKRRRNHSFSGLWSFFAKHQTTPSQLVPDQWLWLSTKSFWSFHSQGSQKPSPMINQLSKILSALCQSMMMLSSFCQPPFLPKSLEPALTKILVMIGFSPKISLPWRISAGLDLWPAVNLLHNARNQKIGNRNERRLLIWFC